VGKSASAPTARIPRKFTQLHLISVIVNYLILFDFYAVGQIFG